MNSLVKVNYQIKSKWSILYVFLLFPILGENIVSTIFGDTISKIASALSCILIVFFLLKRKIHLDMFLIGLILLIMLHIAITFVFASPDTKITVANSIITPYGLIGYFMLFMFIDSVGDSKAKLIEIYKSMAVVMSISVLLNFFIAGDLHIANNVQVFFEAVTTGYTNSRKWMFGHRNAIFIHHMMWMLFSYVQYKLENRDYLKMFLLQIAFTMMVAVVSWNSTMIIITFLIFILGIFRNSLFSKVTITQYVLLYAILEIGIVFVRFQRIFSYLIVNILHRNLSFTGRTSLWDYYINQFARGNIFQKMIGNVGVTDMSTNSHNMFLGLLSFTGIIGVLLYFGLLFLSANKINRKRETDLAKFVSIVIFGFLINSLVMEFYLQPMIAFYIGYRSDRLEQYAAELGD